MFDQATTSPSQKKYVERWQHEYACVQEEQAENYETGYLPIPVKKFPPNEELPAFGVAQEPVKPGQIRLLDPLLVPDSNGFFYVAIVEPWGDFFLFTPFSQFGFPATAGEFLTDQKLSFLKVLCPWNSLTASSSLLERSWVSGSLSDEELQATHTLFWALTQGEDLPDALACRIGAPILDLDDPRIEYQGEQTRALGYISSRTMAELEELEEEAE